MAIGEKIISMGINMDVMANMGIFFRNKTAGNNIWGSWCLTDQVQELQGSAISELFSPLVAGAPFLPFRVMPESKLSAYSDFINRLLQISIGLVANNHGFVASFVLIIHRSQ